MNVLIAWIMLWLFKKKKFNNVKLISPMLWHCMFFIEVCNVLYELVERPLVEGRWATRTKRLKRFKFIELYFVLFLLLILLEGFLHIGFSILI